MLNYEVIIQLQYIRFVMYLDHISLVLFLCCSLDNFKGYLAILFTIFFVHSMLFDFIYDILTWHYFKMVSSFIYDPRMRSAKMHIKILLPGI